MRGPSSTAQLLGLGILTGMLSSPDARLHGQEPFPATQAPPSQEGDREPQPVPSSTDTTLLPIVNGQWWVDRTPVAPRREFFSGLDLDCAACGATGALERFAVPSNPNAPWALQGTVHRDTRIGVVSAGLLGVRNYASPVYTAMPFGSRFEAGPVNTFTPNLSLPDTQWHLTAGVQRTLLTAKNGATLGLAVDAVLPVDTAPVSGDPLRIDPLSSLAVRVRFVLRW
jgi:hypothetical protein